MLKSPESGSHGIAKAGWFHFWTCRAVPGIMPVAHVINAKTMTIRGAINHKIGPKKLIAP